MFELGLMPGHAQWWPHRSGYGSDVRAQEYPLTLKICHSIAGAFKANVHGIQPRVYAIPDLPQFNCNGSCIDGILGKAAQREAKRGCDLYNAGLANSIKLARKSDLLLNFHLDFVNPQVHRSQPSGPMCLVKYSNEREVLWSTRFLSRLEEICGFKRRTRRNKSIFDLASVDDFGMNGVLNNGPRDTVVVECAVATNPLDAAWLVEGQGTEQIAKAAVSAVLEVVRC